MVRANYNTKFAQTAPELTEFRHATVGRVDEMDDETLSESFRKTVHFTNYDSYAPCKANAIVDLFAPGFPDYLLDSSSTSGGLPKTFPNYNRLSKIRSSDADSCVTSDTLPRRTTAFVLYFGCDQMIIEDETNCSVAKIYPTYGPVVFHRTRLNLHPEKDEEKMATFSMAQIPLSLRYADSSPSQYSTTLHRMPLHL